MTEFDHYNVDSVQEPEDWVSSANVIRTDKTIVVKNFFIVDDNEAQFLRGQRINRKAMFGNYTMSVSDFLLGITSLAVAPSIGLPNPTLVGLGKTYIIKDEVGGSATTTITVRSDGEKTIDGSSSTTLTTNYISKRFYSNGSNWFTL